MMKMVKQVLVTYLVFFCIYFVLFMITGRLITNETWRDVLIQTIIYSSVYLIFIMISTRKHSMLIKLIMLIIGIVIIFIPIKNGGMTTTNAMEMIGFYDLMFWINLIIVTLSICIADKQGELYKIEKQIRKEENERVKVLFEELDAHGNVTRKGKADLR